MFAKMNNGYHNARVDEPTRPREFMIGHGNLWNK